MIKKILLLSISFTLLTITLGASTFAWITITTVNRVEGIGINATLGNRLEMSLDGINYEQNLQGQAILDELSKLKLTDVTSYDGKTFYTGIQQNLKEAGKNRDYISLDFYFRSTSPYRNVYLYENVNVGAIYDTPPDEGTYFLSKGVDFRSKVTYQHSETRIVNAGETFKAFASNAIRASFVEQKLNEQDLRDENSLLTTIYDPSENELRGFGKPYGGLAYYNQVTSRNLTPPKIIPETIYQLSKFAEYNPNLALGDESLLLRLIETNELDEYGRVYYKGLLTINIWLEGWDADMFDAILNDTIKIQLTFKPANSLTEINENL